MVLLGLLNGPAFGFRGLPPPQTALRRCMGPRSCSAWQSVQEIVLAQTADAAKEINAKNAMKVDLLGKFVYLLEKSDLPERLNVLVRHDKCTMIVIHSPEELEATPGVVAFLTTLLAEQNVNIIEFISCWTETIIVVEKKDSLKAYEVLSNLAS